VYADGALRLGVLGCASIARQFVRDLTPSDAVHIVAVGSRNADTAAAFAAACGIGRHHGSYEALLTDAELDAVYLPLPNSLHAEWAIRALESGKHVLCEKPLALGRDEAAALFEAARRHDVLLLESLPYLFQPQTRDLRALLDAGAIGAVRSVQASFGFTLPSAGDNIREAGTRRRRVAGRGELPAEPDPPGDGLCAANGARRRDLDRHRGGPQPDGDAAVRRWAPRAAVLRDGCRQPSPRHHRRLQRHDRDRIPQPHQHAGRRPPSLPLAVAHRRGT
jgi:hypothetical protein